MALSPEEARRLALRDLGGLTQTIESTRDVRATWLDTVWRDVGYGARLLRRSPRFTVTALTLLVLGHRLDDGDFLDRVCRAGAAAAVSRRRSAWSFCAEKQGGRHRLAELRRLAPRATSFDGLASSLRRRGHRHERPAPAAASTREA